jgi:hypothetical protein
VGTRYLYCSCFLVKSQTVDHRTSHLISTVNLWSVWTALWYRFLFICSSTWEQRALCTHLQDPSEQPQCRHLPATVRFGGPSRHLLLFWQVTYHFHQQHNSCRVNDSKTEQQIRSQFNGLVAYLNKNLILKWQSFVFVCCQIQRKMCFMFCN